MAVPWMRLLDAALGLTDLARRTRRPPPSATDELSAASAGGGGLEARLAGVVVAALKEAFDRDSRRLDLEREQADAERQRAERALRLELRRQAGDRELGRLRLIAGVAVASWLGTLLFAQQIVEGGAGARLALGVGWVLLLGALGASFAAQAAVGRALSRPDDRADPEPLTSGAGGALAPWLIVAGLAAVAMGTLIN
jgi:hypothetical protein